MVKLRASTGFDAFLKTFPRSEMADDAEFFIGETYYAQNRWPDAIAAYNQVIQNYPMGNAVPDACITSAASRRSVSDNSMRRGSPGTRPSRAFPTATPDGWRNRISIAWRDGHRRKA